MHENLCTVGMRSGRIYLPMERMVARLVVVNAVVGRNGGADEVQKLFFGWTFRRIND